MKKTLIFLLILLIPTGILYGQKARDGTRYKKIVYDTSYHHTKWGIEPADIIFKFRAYTTSFDGADDDNADGLPDKWGVPEWVAYEVHKKTSQVSADRPGKWLSEDSLDDPSVGIAPTDDSYKFKKATKKEQPYSLIYNLSRGHMCPKNIANRLGKDADYNTHTVLNACPQYQWFNNRIWKDMERLVENYADEFGKIWVICGPIFHDKTPQMWLGEKEKNEKMVAVPDAFYKIIIRKDSNATLLDVMAFIYPHAIPQSDNRKVSSKKGYPHKKFLVSVDEIEQLTGLNFFTTLSDSVQNAIEKDAASDVWKDPGEYNLLQ